MMKYEYTIVHTNDDDELVVTRMSAFNGGQASEIAKIVFEDYKHVVMLNHVSTVDTVKLNSVEQFGAHCVQFWEGMRAWLDEKQNRASPALHDIERKAKILQDYLVDMQLIEKQSIQNSPIPPLVTAALHAAAGLNDLPG